MDRDGGQTRSHSVRSAGVHKVLDRIDVTTAVLCFHLRPANLSTRGAQGSVPSSLLPKLPPNILKNHLEKSLRENTVSLDAI